MLRYKVSPRLRDEDGIICLGCDRRSNGRDHTRQSRKVERAGFESERSSWALRKKL